MGVWFSAPISKCGFLLFFFFLSVCFTENAHPCADSRTKTKLTSLQQHLNDQWKQYPGKHTKGWIQGLLRKRDLRRAKKLMLLGKHESTTALKQSYFHQAAVNYTHAGQYESAARAFLHASELGNASRALEMEFLKQLEIRQADKQQPPLQLDPILVKLLPAIADPTAVKTRYPRKTPDFLVPIKEKIEQALSQSQSPEQLAMQLIKDDAYTHMTVATAWMESFATTLQKVLQVNVDSTANAKKGTDSVTMHVNDLILEEFAHLLHTAHSRPESSVFDTTLHLSSQAKESLPKELHPLLDNIELFSVLDRMGLVITGNSFHPLKDNFAVTVQSKTHPDSKIRLMRSGKNDTWLKATFRDPVVRTDSKADRYWKVYLSLPLHALRSELPGIIQQAKDHHVQQLILGSKIRQIERADGVVFYFTSPEDAKKFSDGVEVTLSDKDYDSNPVPKAQRLGKHTFLRRDNGKNSTRKKLAEALAEAVRECKTPSLSCVLEILEKHGVDPTTFRVSP